MDWANLTLSRFAEITTVLEEGASVAEGGLPVKGSRRMSLSVTSTDGETYTKYLKATDVLEILVSYVRKEMEVTKTEFIKVFFALIDLLDLTKAAKMILEKKDFFDQFL